MYIAMDTETALIKRACSFPPLSCLSYCAEDGEEGVHCFLDGTIEQFVREKLENGDHIIFHNAPFDIGVLCEEYPALLPLFFQALDDGRIHDTKIRQKLLDIALGLLAAGASGEKNQGFYRNRYDGKMHLITYSLKALHYRRTGEELEKGQERVTFGPLRMVPREQWPEKHLQYALKDAIVTLPLFMAQQDKRTIHYLEDEKAQVCKAMGLSLITSHGLRTDPLFVERFREVTIEECNKYEGHLRKIKWLVGETLKQVPAQTRMLECIAEGKCEPKLTPKGEDIVKKNYVVGLATGLYKDNKPVFIFNKQFPLGENNLTLKQLAVDKEASEDSGDNDLIIRSKYNSARGILNKTIPVLEKGYEIPIQPQYDSLLATGRTSSYGEKKHKASDPEPAQVGDNIQNQKRRAGTRECYKARDDSVLCSVDYDQAELRTLGQVCYTLLGKSRLMEVLNEGKDPHLDFAAGLAGVSYEKAKQLKKEDDKQIKHLRDLAKPFNFGKPGGMGDAAFQKFAKGVGVKLTIDEVQKYTKEWLNNFPEMVDYFKYVGQEVRTAHNKAQIRHLFSNRYRGGCRFTVACNTRFQGLAADGAAAAMWELTKACYLPGYNDLLFGVRMVAFIHDEFIFEIKDIPGYRWKAAKECARIMVEAFNRFTPDCPVTAEPVLMYHWSKDAGLMKDENKNVILDECGDPIPWDCTLEQLFGKAA